MKCWKCKSTVRAKKVEHHVKVSGVEITGELKAQVCKGCDEETVALEELSRFELAAAAELARNGVATGEAFKFIRKALGLRAADVG